MSPNGRLPASELADIEGSWQRIHVDLGPQTNALVRAFKARFGRTLIITDGYRDYATQERIFLDRYTRTYLPGRPYKVWLGVRWYQRPGTAMAAVPGTSNHGWGRAIDFGSGVNGGPLTPEHQWMQANGPRFGWTWPEWWARSAGEWWHWEATPVPASNYTGTPDVVDVPDVTLPDELEAAVTDVILDRIATVRTTQVAHTQTLAALSERTTAIRVTQAAHTATLAAIKAAVTGDPAPVVDEARLALAVAREVAPAVTAAVIDALPQDTAITPAVVEAAMRNVLGSLNDTP